MVRGEMRKPETVNGVPVPYSAAVSDLVARLKPATEYSWAACVALGHNGSKAALDALRVLTSDADWRYRRSAIEALAWHPLGRSLTTHIGHALSDRSHYVVRAACETVAALELREVHNVVLDLLKSSSSSTRLSALRALSQIWSDEDFATIIKVFRSDRVQAVRREAAWALKANASAATWHHLFAAWLDDPLPRHRIWACEIAVEFGGASVRDKLVQLSGDTDGHVRKAAKRALDAM